MVHENINKTYENFFEIIETDNKNSDIVKTLIMQNNNAKISLQYNSNLIQFKKNENVEVIIIKDSIDEKLVDEKYNFLTHGKVYKVEKQENGKTIIFVSFHGLLCEVTTETESLKNFSDKNIFMLGISQK